MNVWPYLLVAVGITLVLGLIEGYVMIEMMGLFDLALNKEMTAFTSQSMRLMGIALTLVPIAILVTYAKNLYKRKANEQMKNYYLEKMYTKNISEFYAENNAKYLSALTNDFNTLEQKLINPVYAIVDGGAVFIAGMWMIWTVNPKLIGLGILLVIINTGLTLWLQRPITKQTTLRSDLFENYTGYIKEVLSAFHIIRNNNLQGRIQKNFDKKSETVQHKGYLVDRLLTYVYCMENTVSNFMVLGVMGVAGYLALQGKGTIGGVLLVVEGMFRILGPMMMMSEAMPQIASVGGIIKKIEDTLTNAIEAEETIENCAIGKGMSLEDVSFAYDEHQPILEKVNVAFKKGEKYLIIGPSGGGKSTLLKLLRKYFNPTQGTIWMGDVALKEIKKEAYFKTISNIDQKVFIFEDTLRNNLTLYKDYSDEAILEALQQAGLTEFVAAHPDGLGRMLYDDGKNISGGEKSRIAIARALLEKADLILLDEAFSALDPVKAKEIEKSLLDLEDVTIIHVTHVLFKEHEQDYNEIFMVKNKQVYPYRKRAEKAS